MVAWDAYVAWRGSSRYSVPWEYAGRQVYNRLVTSSKCGGKEKPVAQMKRVRSVLRSLGRNRRSVSRSRSKSAE